MTILHHSLKHRYKELQHQMTVLDPVRRHDDAVTSGRRLSVEASASAAAPFANYQRMTSVTSVGEEAENDDQRQAHSVISIGTTIC
jgi:hypothetical protein